MDKIPKITLPDFLAGSNARSDLMLPLVHSAQAAKLRDIINSGSLLATKCDVFTKDKLCYLFVGRPAYKTQSVDNPSTWQLPIAFVVRFHEQPKFKRVFPFDSGAFHRKRLPSYITMFNLDDYNLASNPTHIGRVMSLFFETRERYMGRRAAGFEEIKREHLLGPEHQEIQALAKLYLEGSSAAMDDRAAAIEVQIDHDISLSKENLLGIVVPEEYARSPMFKKALRSMTTVIETYDLLPLSTRDHYSLIYDRVLKIYKKLGIPV